MKAKFKKSLATAALLVSCVGVGLALVPHHACACGQYEDGSQFTHFANSVSKAVIGKQIIETNPKPSL